MDQPKVDKHSDRTVYSQLADILREEIVAGRLRPGQKLPSERELTEHHDVARGTVREALIRLRTEGLIGIEHGRGAFVREVPALLQVPMVVEGSPGPPATIVSAIEALGQHPSVRPMGIAGHLQEKGGLQTAVILFAHGVPVATWHARVESRARSWPGLPHEGIHETFPPAKKPEHRTQIRVPAAGGDERRLLNLPAGAAVVEVESSYLSTKGLVTHLTVFAAERVMLVHPQES